MLVVVISMKNILFVLGVVLILAGCTSPSATAPLDTTTNPPASNTVETSTTGIVAPGDPIIFCNSQTIEENEECFEEAFETCEKTLGVFWETSDGYSLVFETKGIDASTGNCLVRVTAGDTDSQFYGQSADCSIAKSPASETHDEPYFDSYSIGPDTCVGTYIDSIVKSSANTAPPQTPAPSTPTLKEFSFSVDDDGVIGTNEFSVNKGDTVRLNITVATSNVSFGGAWVRGPAGSKLANDSDYIFTTGNVSPGASKTVEFVANDSFEFGIYWPGSNVLKGKGKVTVQN